MSALELTVSQHSLALGPIPKHRPPPLQPTAEQLRSPPASLPPLQRVSASRLGSHSRMGVSSVSNFFFSGRSSARARSSRAEAEQQNPPEDLPAKEAASSTSHGISEQLKAHQEKYCKIAEERRKQALLRFASRDHAHTDGTCRPKFTRRLSGICMQRHKPDADLGHTSSRSLSRLSKGGHHTLASSQEHHRRLGQPEFLEAVVQMMSDPKTVKAFAFFDADGSGEIDQAEMRTLIAMVSPDTLDVEVEAMVKELDLNQDGAVDLWEFCVQMQIMKERKTAEERAYEVDMAFELFETDEHGRVSAKELRRIFCESGGAAFNAEEFEEMLEDLGISNDGHIAMQELRNHTSFQT